MVERGTQMLGPAASAHVEAVRGETGAQHGGTEAAHVTGFGGTLEAVNHHHVPGKWPWRPLRIDGHLHIRLSAE